MVEAESTESALWLTKLAVYQCLQLCICVTCRHSKYSPVIQVWLSHISHVWWCVGMYWVCIVVLLQGIAWALSLHWRLGW